MVKMHARTRRKPLRRFPGNFIWIALLGQPKEGGWSSTVHFHKRFGEHSARPHRKDHHMSRTTTLAAATVLAAALFLAACGNDDDAKVETNSNSSSSQGQQAETPAQPVSKSESVVQRFTSALDDLGLEHAEPARAEVALSGAQMRFDMPVNGYDAGINIFPDKETLAAWQKASDALGGIHIALPDADAVLTLNSSEGIADSAKIAPMIAEAVGGTAHGV